MTDPIDFNQIASMLPSMEDMGNKMEKMNAKLQEVVVVGEAGGGMVKVFATADMRINKIDIEESLISMNDPEMMSDLITAAVNVTINKCREKTQEITMQELGPLGSMLQNSPFQF